MLLKFLKQKYWIIQIKSNGISKLILIVKKVIGEK
jgi:hypothetical protein